MAYQTKNIYDVSVIAFDDKNVMNVVGNLINSYWVQYPLIITDLYLNYGSAFRAVHFYKISSNALNDFFTEANSYSVVGLNLSQDGSYGLDIDQNAIVTTMNERTEAKRKLLDMTTSISPIAVFNPQGHYKEWIIRLNENENIPEFLFIVADVNPNALLEEESNSPHLNFERIEEKEPYSIHSRHITDDPDLLQLEKDLQKYYLGQPDTSRLDAELWALQTVYENKTRKKYYQNLDLPLDLETRLKEKSKTISDFIKRKGQKSYGKTRRAVRAVHEKMSRRLKIKREQRRAAEFERYNLAQMEVTSPFISSLRFSLEYTYPE